MRKAGSVLQVNKSWVRLVPVVSVDIGISSAIATLSGVARNIELAGHGRIRMLLKAVHRGV